MDLSCSIPKNIHFFIQFLKKSTEKKIQNQDPIRSRDMEVVMSEKISTASPNDALSIFLETLTYKRCLASWWSIRFFRTWAAHFCWLQTRCLVSSSTTSLKWCLHTRHLFDDNNAILSRVSNLTVFIKTCSSLS